MRHWLGLENASIVGTQWFHDTQDLLADIVDCGGILALLGDAGYGKTWALDYYLATATVRTIKHTPFATTFGRGFAAALLRQLEGGAEDPRGSEQSIALRLIDELERRPTLAAIDEADWLTRGALKTARGLHLELDGQLAYVFVGGPDFEQRLLEHPALANRCVAVRFGPLSADDVLACIPSYHPIWRNVSDELLLSINRRCANGCLRLWATVTYYTAKECARQGLEQPTRDLINQVLRSREVLSSHASLRRRR